MTAITNIDVVFSEDALFGDVTGEDVDRPASVAAYRASLINYIYDAYPQAEIVVTAGITDSVTVNGASDHAEIDAIKSLMDACWNGDDWLTYAEETSPRVELWEDNAGGLYDGATQQEVHDVQVHGQKLDQLREPNPRPVRGKARVGEGVLGPGVRLGSRRRRPELGCL